MSLYARIENSVVMEVYDSEVEMSELCHPDIVWMACPPDTVVGWVVSGEALSPPPGPTKDQIAAENLAVRDDLLRAAGLRIAPLQDAVDLGEATDDETASLKLWKQYRVQLNRIESQAGWPENVAWPESP